MPDDLKLLTKQEAMKILRFDDERTIDRLIANGKIAFRKHGNRTMFAEEDVADYVRSIRMVGKRKAPDESKASGKRDLGNAISEAIAALARLKTELDRA